MNLLGQVAAKAFTLRTLTEAGIIRPTRPDKVARLALTLARWGPIPAAGYKSASVRYPNETAIIDELGQLTFTEVHERSNGLAHAFADAGIEEGDNVAVLCRNHRGFIDTTVALSKLGANALYLNTGFAAPQIEEVSEREDAKAIVFDEEFAELVAEGLEGRDGYLAWTEPDNAGEHDYPVLEDLIEGGDPEDPVPPG